MENVMVDGKAFEITEHNRSTDGRTTQETIILRRVENVPKPKQDIRDYCREHRVWAAKDCGGEGKPSGGWWGWTHRPETKNNPTPRTWNLNYGSVICLPSNLAFPSCPWDKSLITPDGSMPLMEPKHKNFIKFGVESSFGVALEYPPKMKQSLPRRGDPIFAWDDRHDPRCPVIVLYYHHTTSDGKIACFKLGAYGESMFLTVWDHYRPFDASLVGVPRKDWPEAQS